MELRIHFPRRRGGRRYHIGIITIVFDTLKAIIGCIGVRSTPYKCLRIEMGFGLLKNSIPPECGHTEKIDRDTVIIRIDLERHDNYGHFYSTFFHEMIHMLASFDCSEIMVIVFIRYVFVYKQF